MDYVIRPLTRQDEPILWEMLYYGLSSAGKNQQASRDVVRRPEISRYVEDWGRVGDTGFVAHDKKNRALLGAAWLRRPIDKSDASPELALAVKPEHRRYGIGTALRTNCVSRAVPMPCLRCSGFTASASSGDASDLSLDRRSQAAPSKA